MGALGVPHPRGIGEPSGPLREPSRIGLLELGVAAVVMIALLPNCFGRSCSDEDLQLAERIPHYSDTQLEFFDDPEGPGCAAVLEVRADVAEVVDHYRGALEEDGWDVSVRETMVEGQEGESAPELIARRGEAEVTIVLEAFDGQVSAAIRVDA